MSRPWGWRCDRLRAFRRPRDCHGRWLPRGTKAAKSGWSEGGAQMAWKAQSIQAVFFTAGANVESAIAVFTKATGAEPLSSQSLQLPNGARQSNASGKLEQFGLSVQSQPGRMDVFLLPQAAVVPTAGIPGDFPIIDDVEAASRSLVNTLSKIADIPSNRLALVLNLIEPAQGPKDATIRVAKLIEIPMIFDDAAEVLFRINRPKEVTISSGRMPINRIMTWTLQSFQTININLNPIQQLSAPPASYMFAAGLQVDLNTALQPRSPFSNEDTHSIFEQLRAEAYRLSDPGNLSALGDE